MVILVYFRVIQLLTVSSVLCRADGAYSFAASVPTDAPPGTDVVSLQSFMETTEKFAEVPCVIVNGDPYSRFDVTTNCTVVVARPLDSTVQSEYLLKIRVRRLKNRGNAVVRLRVNVTDVSGYPPVYHETCETPVRISEEGTDEFLFSLFASGEGEMASGDVVYFKETLNRPQKNWNMEDPKFLVLTGNACQFSIAVNVRNVNDMRVAAEIFQSYAVNDTFKVFCRAEFDQTVSLQLFNIRGDHTSALDPLEQVVPNFMTELQNPLLVYLISVAYPTTRPTRFNCDIPPLVRPMKFDSDLDSAAVKHLHRFSAAVNPVGCVRGRYGPFCDKICICENGARCHGFNGACKCTAGWQGVACDIPKPGVSATTTPSDPSDIYISANVTVLCQAHHVDATKLSLRLPNGSEIVSHGAEKGSSVMKGVDAYKVPAVAGGPVVSVRRDGLETSARQNVCTVRTVKIAASPVAAKTGRYVATATYRYGLKCQQTCTCENGAVCDNVDGSCKCVAPWTGKNCNEKQSTEPLVESLVPVGCLIVLVVFIATILYKKKLFCEPGAEEDTEALLQMQQVEVDLAQTVIPGWLSRWETTSSRDLTLGALVGWGMFGHVIQGTLRSSTGENISVAAKTVRRTDAQCHRNFYREAAVLVAVHEDEHHSNVRSNIIQLLGLINETSHKYILLEYASRGSLLRLLQQARRQGEARSFLRYLRYGVHVARALQELQRLAITHCDVAARNVLITADDVAKLADFGLARDEHHVYDTIQYVADDAQPDKRGGELAGNLERHPLNWMSLESLETGQYTCESDVWSFGVLLWEIATLGREPRYPGTVNNRPSCRSLAQTVRRGIRLRRPPECSGLMYDVMSSCWRENPSARPDAEEMETRILRLNLSFEMETAL
ncbi:Endothelial cell-specific molecule 1 [Branchiostoma belcheri]|nr:Endothelial cell-specific molecule 1 [Branchiostoma belcheri]